MSKQSHTKGPWKVESVPMKIGMPTQVAYLIHGHTKEVLSHDEIIANENLIASAPELLQLLERGLESGVFDDAPVYKADVEKLIIKARGGE